MAQWPAVSRWCPPWIWLQNPFLYGGRLTSLMPHHQATCERAGVQSFFGGGSRGVGRSRMSDLEEMLEQTDAFCVSCFVWKLQRIVWHSIFVLNKCVLKEAQMQAFELLSHGAHGCDIMQSDHKKNKNNGVQRGNFVKWNFYELLSLSRK